MCHVKSEAKVSCNHSVMTFRNVWVIACATIIMGSKVFAASITWDANGTDSGQTDGAGTWLNTNRWWNGTTNTSWNNSTPDDAIIGNGGTGGTITLGAVTVGSVTFTNFSGTYTLSGGTNSNSNGITVAAGSGTVTINSTLTGAGGLTMNGSGILTLTSVTNAYTGPTVVTKGILQLGTYWSNAQSIPGGISGVSTNGSNLEINGGNVKLWYYLKRALGPNPGQLQITGGVSGFSLGQADCYNAISVSNNANCEIVWGSDYFKPEVLVMNEPAATPLQVMNIQNKIDLNGATRTLACNATNAVSSNYINSNNGNMATAGGRLTGVIRNSGTTPAGIIKTGIGVLQLTNTNTFDGGITVSNGVLELIGSANSSVANPLGRSAPSAANLLLCNGTILRFQANTLTSCDRGFTIDGTSNGDSVSLVSSSTNAINMTSSAPLAYGAVDQTRALILTGSSTATNTLSAAIGDNGTGAVSLLKTGSGTWVLNGVNTYSGDTTVSNGTLRVVNKTALSSSTTLYLVGTLDLGFTGTRQVAGLYINGVKQADGVYSANGSTITGPGTLSIGAPGGALMFH